MNGAGDSQGAGGSGSKYTAPPAPAPGFTVVAIDPGETSGFVRGFVVSTPGCDLDAPDGIFRVDGHGQWRGMDELRYLETFLFKPGYVIVAEDYRVYPHKASEHIGSPVYTARELGRVEWLAYIHECVLIQQSASMAKQRWTNHRLRNHFPRLWEQTTNQGHIRDAARHLFAYLEVHGLHVFFRKEDAI